MKKKLLVLSASAILASNFVFDNSASAVVRGTDYKSEALDIIGKKHSHLKVNDYKKNIGDLIYSLSLNDFAGYDEPEYKNAYQKYQNRFLGELEALNKFILEDTDDKFENKGLTFDRYKSIYKSLNENRDEFDSEVSKIEDNNKDLRRFDYREQHNANKEIYDLEHKALMLALTFIEHDDARENLYNKLDMIIGYKPDERKLKKPTNNRMLKDTKENLETIIDEFFDEIDLARPKDLPILSSYNKDDENVKQNLRKSAEEAKNNKKLEDPTVKERADRATKRLEELTKKSREAKAEAEIKAKAKLMQQKSYKKEPEAFPHKQLKNELSIKFSNAGPQLPTYTVSTQSQTQPVLKQYKETYTSGIAPRFNQNNTLKGMEGESAPITVVSEPAIKATAAPQTKEMHTGFSGSNNNLSGMSGESKEVSYTYNSQPVDVDIITESNEIILDQHETISGFTTGVSTEAHYSSDELVK